MGVGDFHTRSIVLSSLTCMTNGHSYSDICREEIADLLLTTRVWDCANFPQVCNRPSRYLKAGNGAQPMPLQRMLCVHFVRR